MSDYQGLFVKEADKLILRDLRPAGLVKYYRHYDSYRHCWRCSLLLIYRAISSWFVNIGKVKKSMWLLMPRLYWVAHLC